MSINIKSNSTASVGYLTRLKSFAIPAADFEDDPENRSILPYLRLCLSEMGTGSLEHLGGNKDFKGMEGWHAFKEWYE